MILEKLSKCSNNFNLGINLSKCVLGQSSLNNVGFEITGDDYHRIRQRGGGRAPMNFHTWYRYNR